MLEEAAIISHNDASTSICQWQVKVSKKIEKETEGVERTHPMESSPRDLARRSRLAFIFVQFFFLWEATLYSPYAVCQGR